MERKFSKHYTREEVRAMLPQVSIWLRRLQALREEFARLEVRVAALLEPGNDVGGESVNAWSKCYAEMRLVLREFASREIQIKELDRGLLDFPSLRGNKEVFLCWEQGEEDVEFWHDLDTGYAGREHL